MKSKLGDRIISLILSFNLVFNNLAPFVSLATVRAQEVTPEPTAEVTVSPTEEPIPTLEVSPTETVSPTVEPTQDVTPTPTVDVTPTVEVTPVEETSPTVEPTLEPTEAPSVPSPPSDSPTPEMSVEPTPSPSPTIEPLMTPNGHVDTQVVETYVCRADSLNGCLMTDKADYAPTEVVLITGYGFAPSTQYSLRIYSTDEPAVDVSYQITTNANGSFTYSYQLDGNYRPNYTVELKDAAGFVVATVTFTDTKPGDPPNPPNPAADLDQCKNETATSPQSPCEWVNGSLNSNQAHYVEGLSVPYRLRMTNLTDGSHSVVLGYDIKHSGAHALDFLTHYNRLEPHSPFGHSAETIDPTANISGLGAPNTFAIPAPSSAGSPVSGQPTTLFNSLSPSEKLMTIYNGTITGISYPTQGNLTDSQSETTIQINFTSTDPTVVLAWGGHIATEQTWGAGNSAGGISGAPYHMRLKDLDGSGGNQDRSLQAGAVAPPSSITVIKDAQPNNAQDFAFTTTGNGLSNFSLDDDADGTLSNTVTFNSLLTGTFTVTETLIPGWKLVSKTCQSDGTGSSSSQITDGVSITLVAGENVTCTFTNTQVTGSITIVKNAVPDDAQDFSFTGDLGAFSLDDDVDNTLQNTQTFSSLVGGTYVVTEGLLSNWNLTGLTCNDTDGGTTVDLATRTATIDLDHGQNLTCTYSNTKKGHIIVDKVTVPSGETQSFDFTATGTDYSNFSLTDAANPNDQELLPGNYSVSEIEPSGWDLTNTVCVSSIQDTEVAGSLELDPGETITCTFTNTKRGSIIVEKQTTPDGASGNFTFKGTASGTISDNGQITVNNLVPGQYTSTESDPTPGFDLTNITCDDANSTGNTGSRVATFNVEAGETVKCTFANTQRGSISGYKYEDIDGNPSTNEYLSHPVQGLLVELWKWITGTTYEDTGLTDTTDSNGYYEFLNVIPGVYQVREILSSLGAAWTNLTSTSTSNITVDPGEPNPGNNFVNTRYGTIIIEKQTVPDEDQTVFDFDLSYGDNDADLSDGQQDNSGNLLPGPYLVSENTPAGWDLTSTVCTSSKGDTETASALELDSGETITCVFTNSRKPTLTLIKTVINNNGGSAVATDFQGKINGNNVPWSIAQTLNPGNHTASESSLTNYTASVWGTHCNADGTITLAYGQNKTCSITNDDNAPALHLRKTVTKDNGGTALATAWTLTATGTGGSPTNLSGSTPVDSGSNFKADTYALAESGGPPSGYTAGSWDCGQATMTDPTHVVVPFGGDVTCTINNNDNVPSLTLNKVVVNNNGGTAVESDWTLTATGPTSISGPGAVGDSDVVSDSTFNAGTYTLSESTGPAGYTASSWVCTGGSQSGNEITIGLGESATCTITNSDNEPSLTLVKEVTNDDGGTSGPSAWTLTATGSTGFSGAGPSVSNGASFDVGTYDLSESGPTGYSASAWVCVGGNQSDEDTVSVGLGENVTCTITNDDIAPTLRLVKEVEGGSSTPSDWTLRARTLCVVGNTDPACGFSDSGDSTTFHPLAANKSYRLLESGPSGYTAGNWSCDNTGVQGNVIVLDLDQETTCTITNTRDIGNIVLTKLIDADGDISTTDDRTPYEGWVMDVDPDGNDTSDPSLDPTDASGNTGVNGIKTGNYWVREDPNGPTDNYHFLDSYCTLDGEPTGNSGTSSFGGVEVAKDKTTYCTFVNVRDTGDLIIHKEVQSEVDGPFESADPGDFKWGLSEGNTPYEMGSGQTLETGEYNVYENEVPGYHPVGWYFTEDGTCEDPSESELPANVIVSEGTTEITLCNVRDTGTITVIKNIDGNNDGDLDDDVDQTNVEGWTWDIGKGEQNISMGETKTLVTGNYSITEDEKPDDYAFVSWSCDNDTSGTTNSIPLTLNDQDNITCEFINTPLTDVHGRKWHDRNADEGVDLGEEFLSGWTIFIDENDNQILDGEEQSTLTDENGWYVFNNLYPGTYDICEVLQPGWVQTFPSAVCHTVTVPETISDGEGLQNEIFGIPYDFGNQEQADVTVVKYQDDNGNGQFDKEELTLPNWEIFLSKLLETTNSDGEALFEDIRPGLYELSETIKEGYIQTEISCFDGEYVGENNSLRFEIRAGDQVTCYIGNQPVNPELQISKSNDATGDKGIGDLVTYTIKVKNLNSKIKDVILKDLLPNGFTFQNVLSIIKNGTDDITASVGNPGYASPGTYNLGNMETDDEIVIKYTAKIGSTVDPGLYKDAAYAYGTDLLDRRVLALAQPEGFVSTNFVGTSVNVNATLTQGGNVDIGGEVLGASTQLPATGGNAVWIIIASILTGLGLLFMLAGLFMKKAKILTSILLALLFYGFVAGSAHAASLTIRLEQPKSPTSKNDFKITYTVLDLSDSPSTITVKCFKKGPTEGGYSQFGSDIVVAAGGNSGDCANVSDFVNTNGTYQFYATANNGSETATSESEGIISVGYNTQGDPTPPSNYKKEKISSCQYRITFHTANDGLTTRVEVYRSDSTSFNLDGSTRVGDISIGPDQDGTFEESVPDCNKTYYYVIRSFNSSGNPSGPVGDSAVTVISGTTTTEGGAIPVEGVTLPGGGAGQVLGEEAGEATPTAKPEVVEVKNKGVIGAVKGVTDFIKNRTKLSVLIAAAVLGLGYGVYYFLKKRGQTE